MARKKRAVKQKTGVQKAIDALDKKAAVETTANSLKTPAKKVEKPAVKKSAAKKPAETKATEKPSPEGTDKKASGKKALGWILLSFILAAALAGLAWLFMQQKVVVDGLKTEMASSQTSLATLKSDMTTQAEVQQAATAKKPDWAAQAAEIQAQLDKLAQADEQTVSSLTAMSEANKEAQGEQVDARTEWAQAELGYLIKLANHRIALAQDVAGAKTALKLADDRARALGEPSLFPLRSLLADEIQALAAVAEVDIVGISAKLQSSIKRVEQLQIPLAPEVNKAEPAPEPADAVAETSASEISTKEKVDQALGGVWKELKSLVVIRHQTDGETAVIAPDQRYFLYQNLRLKLETAKLALLRGEQAIYESSLQSAAEWTETYFSGASQEAMVQALTELQQQQITVTTPDISGSLQWLSQRGNN